MISTSGSGRLDLHDVAHRTSAFIYGNILVLAALIVVSPDQIETGYALTVVAGTGLSTYLAHCVAEQQEIHVLHGRKANPKILKRAFRNALPVLSSTAIPTVMLSLGYWRLTSVDTAWTLANALIIIRLLFNGVIVARYRGEKVTSRAILSGLVLAILATGVAFLKAYLTH